MGQQRGLMPVIGKGILVSVALLAALFQYLMGQLRIQAIEMVSFGGIILVAISYRVGRTNF